MPIYTIDQDWHMFLLLFLSEVVQENKTWYLGSQTYKENEDGALFR